MIIKEIVPNLAAKGYIKKVQYFGKITPEIRCWFNKYFCNQKKDEPSMIFFFTWVSSLISDGIVEFVVEQ